VQLRLHRRRQTIEALPHVRRNRGQPHARSRRNRSSPSKRFQHRLQPGLGNRPVQIDSRAQKFDFNRTGARPPQRARAVASSRAFGLWPDHRHRQPAEPTCSHHSCPPLCKRHHLNSRFVFTRLRCATSEIDTQARHIPAPSQALLRRVPAPGLVAPVQARSH